MKPRRSRLACIAACAVASLGAIGLTACGGSGPSLSEQADAASVAAAVAGDQVDLAMYCLDQATDGTGDWSKASDALDRIIAVTLRDPGAIVGVDGTQTVRDELLDAARNLNTCDPGLSQLAFNVLATLPA
jgi:hypothetical protein